MSALDHKQTFRRFELMSALPPKADIGRTLSDVRFVPQADSCTAAKMRLSSAPQPRGRPEGNGFLRANQTLRWVDIAQVEKMRDGSRQPFGMFD
jgi:hypothetical protein